MNTATLARLALKHAYNAAAEEIYLKTEHDYTKPVTFYGLVNERCNVKCRYCEYWRLASYKNEMSIDEWKESLLSVKDFVGTYSISFSGGEPFIKPGFLDLMAFCHANGIHSGVTTNGSALNRKNAQKLVAARPFNSTSRSMRQTPRCTTTCAAGRVCLGSLATGSSMSARSATRRGSTSRSSSRRPSTPRTSGSFRTW